MCAHGVSGRNLREVIVMAETGLKVILAVFMTLMFGPTVQAQDVQERYSKSCAVCHAAGAAGAPKTGDVAQWKPRLEKGMDVLVQSVETFAPVHGPDELRPRACATTAPVMITRR